jgi:hypothetical protein
MAHDLERWTQGRFVQAHRYTAMERMLNLYRRYRVPVVLALVGLTATSVVATVGAARTAAERDRAMAAAADARHLSATLLARRADGAWRDGDTVAARAYAVSSLELEESPAARGVLLAAWGAPDVRALPDMPMPYRCLDLLAAPTGADVLCLGEGELSRVAPSGEVRWRQAVDMEPTRRSLALASAPGATTVWLAGASSVQGIDVATGDLLVEHPSELPVGLVVTAAGPWWLEGGSRVRGPDGFQKKVFGSYASALLAPKQSEEAPLIVRGRGLVETLDGVVLHDVFQVNYGAVSMADGAVWTLGARSLVLPADGGAPRPIDVGRASLFAGRQRDGLTALGAIDGSVFATDGTDPDSLVRLPPTGIDVPRFDVRRLDGRAELLLADADRVRRWWLDRTRPPVRLHDDLWRKQAVAADGRSWLWCGTEGRYAWFSGDGMVQGRVDAEGFPSFCSIVDDVPYVSWGGLEAARVVPGGTQPIEVPRRTKALFGHQGRLLPVSRGRLRYGEQELGGTLLDVDGDRLRTIDFEGAQPSQRVTWRWDGQRYVQEATEVLPRGTLCLLDDGSVVRVDGLDVVVERDGRERLRLRGHVLRPSHGVPLPGGRLVTGGLDGRVLVWDLAGGALLADLDLGGGRVGSMDYLPGPQLLLVATFDGAFQVLGVDGVFASSEVLARGLVERVGMGLEDGELVLVDAP